MVCLGRAGPFEKKEMGVPARLGGSIPGLAEWNVAKERHRLLKEIATHGVDSQYLSSSVATSLFLVRVLTSLRVSSAASKPIGVHLRAMEQFFKSLSHGWALSEEFIEAGGVRVVVEVLNRWPSPDCLRVLLALSRIGRRVKEHICECDAVDALVRALLAKNRAGKG